MGLFRIYAWWRSEADGTCHEQVFFAEFVSSRHELFLSTVKNPQMSVVYFYSINLLYKDTIQGLIKTLYTDILY